MRNPQTGLPPRPCVVCGSEFQPYRAHVVTCSRKCRDANPAKEPLPWATTKECLCRFCGVTFVVEKASHAPPKTCPECQPLAEKLKNDRKNAARLIANRPDLRAKNRAWALKSIYGITVEQYDEMLATQNGVCFICGDPPDPNGVRAASRLHVDHCHATGTNRKLLCLCCNNGLGHFRDDPARLRSAAEYLEQHRNT